MQNNKNMLKLIGVFILIIFNIGFYEGFCAGLYAGCTNYDEICVKTGDQENENFKSESEQCPSLNYRATNTYSLPTNNSSFSGLYLHSAVSSDAIPCASVSSNIMSVKGGNAIDGAIAGLLCTCSVNFHSCGIGGGSLLLFYNKTQKQIYAYDIREMAPKLATNDTFANKDSSIFGGKSIAVMGLVSGYYEIHKKFGKLDWKTLFEPTIDILNNGFYVSQNMEIAIDYFFKKTTSPEFKELRDILTNPTTGKPKRYGDKIKIPKLANTMKTLSIEPYAMKNGSLVDDMIAEITAEGGIISKDDLSAYETKIREPISVNLTDNSTLYTMPPPSSGVLVAFSLNVLADFPPQSLDSYKNMELFFHRLIETMKFSFAKRSDLGDIDFVNNTELLKNLKSQSYSKSIKSRITDDETQGISYYGQSYGIKTGHGTSHFSLVSPDEDAVSVSSSINYYFGSFIMGNKTGIIYNNHMDDFSFPDKTNIYNLKPSPSNYIEPYKRPMSSMSPIIIVDSQGNVELVIGASGGSKILSATTQITILAKLFNKTIKEAIDTLRVHHQFDPNEVFTDMNFPDFLIKSLRKKGHFVEKESDISVGQGIKKSSNQVHLWECCADFRKMGLCDGF